jgi:hypothetical protein
VLFSSVRDRLAALAVKGSNVDRVDRNSIKTTSCGVPHEEIAASTSTRARLDHEVTRKINRLFTVFQRISAETTQIRPLISLEVAKVGWLHHPSIHTGGSIVPEPRENLIAFSLRETGRTRQHD